MLLMLSLDQHHLQNFCKLVSEMEDVGAASPCDRACLKRRVDDLVQDLEEDRPRSIIILSVLLTLSVRSAVGKVEEGGRTKQVTSRSAVVADALEAAPKDVQEPQVACHNSNMNPSWAAPKGKAHSNVFPKGAMGNSG
jgi:hypothetical protein